MDAYCSAPVSPRVDPATRGRGAGVQHRALARRWRKGHRALAEEEEEHEESMEVAGAAAEKRRAVVEVAGRRPWI